MGLLDRFRRPADRPVPGQGAVADGTEPGQRTPEPVVEHQAEEHAPVAVAEPDPNRQHLGAWLDLTVEQIADHPDAIERIYAGTLDGISIRGVFDPAAMATGVSRVREHSDEFRDHGTTIMFGTALVGSADDRADYYADAPTINGRIDELFDVDFVGTVGGVISAFAGGRPAVVPEEPGRGAYVPATVRFLPPGRGVMHAHTANEFCNVWHSYDHLREIAVMWNSLSYFVVGQAPDDGGNLVLYDLMWDDTPEDVLALPMSPERDALLERFGTAPTDLRTGDMILFTGGRIWHRVEPVSGEVERVTIGGFVALSQDDESVYFWS